MLSLKNFFLSERIPMKKYSGHINFIYDIVNKNKPGTYDNADQAGIAIYNFQRRLHETINLKKRHDKNKARADNADCSQNTSI